MSNQSQQWIVRVVVILSVLVGGSFAIPAQARVVIDHTPVAHAPSTMPPHLRLQQAGGSRREIVSLRTQNSRTFQEGNRFVTQVYGAPVNYRDASGAWQPIDNTLVPSTHPGAAFENRANDYKVFFPPDLAAPIHIETRDGWVEFALKGARGTGVIAGSTDTFSLPGAQLKYTVESQAVKEDIVLSAATSPGSYTFTVHASNGLSARQTALGGIDFVDGSGRVVFGFLPPSVQDAGHGRSRVSLSLSGQMLTLSVDPHWLSDPARRFPVTIDPSMAVTTSATQDCWIESVPTRPDPNQGVCFGSSDQIGTTGTNDFSRTLLQFAIQSAIPPKATIDSADLGLWESSFANNNGSVSVGAYALTHSWTTGVNWFTYDGTNPWTNPGGDLNGLYATTGVSPNANIEYHWNLTTLVQRWYAGTIANDGVLLKGVEPAADLFNFYNTGTGGSYAPVLSVTYEFPAVGNPGWYTFDGAAGLDINVASGNLLLGQGDLSMDGVGLPLTFGRYYNSLNAGVLSDVGYGWLTSSGKDVSLQSQPGGSQLLQGSSGFSAQFQPNGSGGFTSPAGVDGTLTGSGTSFTLTGNASGTKLNFSNGLLVSEQDRSGNTISFNYGSPGLTSIVDTLGHTTTVSYNPSTLISQLTDPASRTYQYGYDTSNNLTSFTDPKGLVTHYSYDTSHHLTGITDPKNNLTTIAYDTSGRVTSITDAQNHVTTFTYNSGSTVVTDTNGHATTYAYDSAGRVTGVTYPDSTSAYTSWTADNHVAGFQAPNGTTTSYAYNNLNNLTQVSMPNGSGTLTSSCQYSNTSSPYLPSSCTDPQGNTTSYQYTTQGLVSTVTDASNHSQSFTYNSNGTLASSTDENGHTTTHTYAANGLPLQDMPPAPLGTTSYTFDSANREATVTTGKGQVTSFSYDANNQVTGIDFNSQLGISFAYDANGNMTSMTDATGTTTYTYDSLDQLTKKTLPNGQSVSYTYDNVGNLLTKTDSAGTITYGYNVDDQVTTVKDRLGAITTLGYDANGNPTTMAFPNGVSQNMTYNGAGQLTRAYGSGCTSGTCPSFSYSYTNPANNAQTALAYSMSDALSQTTSYSYDHSNQLTQAIQKSSAGSTINSWTYSYDPAGNLTSKTANGAGSTFTYNAANELTQASGAMSKSYTYDANGSLTGISDGTQMSINAAGQIMSITPPGGPAISMSYTGVGQSQRTAAGSTNFNYDRTSINSMVTSGGTTYFTRDPEGALISESTPSGTYYYLHDGLGSIVGLTDSTGKLVNLYSYDPYGNPVSVSEQVPNPFRFTEAIWDAATGLYKMGARYYDPTSGRFSQRDPAGGGYTYVDGDPVNATDPSGLCSIETEECYALFQEASGISSEPQPQPYQCCPRFDQAGIPYTTHFKEAVEDRGGETTEVQALDAYQNGTYYYDTKWDNCTRVKEVNSSQGKYIYVAYDPQGGGEAQTVFFASSRPNKRRYIYEDPRCIMVD